MPLHEHNIAASFKAICENATAALFVIDASQNCIYANPAAEILTGFKASDLIGRRLHEVIHHTRPDGSNFPISECRLDRALPSGVREKGEDVFIHADGSFYPVSYTASPIVEDGEAVGTVVEVQGLAKKKAIALEREREKALLANTFDNAAVGIAHVGHDGRWLRINEKLCEIFGYDRDELLGLTFQDITHPDDLDDDLVMFEKLKSGAIVGYNLEKRYYRKDGTVIWARLTTSSQKNASGTMEFCIAVLEDITTEKEHQQHLDILAGELQHRVKNTLAMVQAIARMSLPEDTAGKEAFLSRILALSRSHDLLLADNWSGSGISDLVELATHPFGGTESGRINVSGPPCRLSSRTSLALSMAINELCTNAMKYGALSVDEGTVNIRWNFNPADDRSQLKFIWQEIGGPEVSPPERKGFGTTLIERALASELTGETAVEYLPSGVTFKCSFPVD
ncbi:MAG: hypothetical protein COA41_04420 [Sphingopyxis sp.]|nr:MAG: hypothetical protein COA41_04420 [Sphingopyxis sp.]